MYLPWIRFPVDSRRKTGLLFPDIGSDTRGGIDITTPIYLNLAPNYDALYSPRFIQERGLLHQTKFRWLSEHTGLWELNGGWIGDDSKYQDDYPIEDGNRWLIGAKQQGSFGDHFRTYVNFTRVSDYEYLKDLENNSLSAQRQTALQQLGRVEWVNSQWLLQLDFEQFQSLAKDIPEDYRKLPQFTAMWIGEAAWLGIRPIVTSQLSHFDIDTDRVTGQRFYNEIGLTQPRQWAFGFLTPTVKYRSVQYELDRPFLPLDTSPSAGSFTGSVDGGLIFERQTTLGGAAMTQTLEPRVYYLYSEFDEQPYQPVFDSAELTFSYGQLYRDTRFSGHDRLDDANQLSAGVTTRFFDNTTGEERLNASIGQIFYFKDRKIRLNATDPVLAEATSPIAGEFNWLPNSAWRISASALYDTNDNTFDAASAQVTLFTDQRRSSARATPSENPRPPCSSGPLLNKPMFRRTGPLTTSGASLAHLSTPLKAALPWRICLALSTTIAAGESGYFICALYRYRARRDTDSQRPESQPGECRSTASSVKGHGRLRRARRQPALGYDPRVYRPSGAMSPVPLLGVNRSVLSHNRSPAMTHDESMNNTFFTSFCTALQP